MSFSAPFDKISVDLAIILCYLGHTKNSAQSAAAAANDDDDDDDDLDLSRRVNWLWLSYFNQGKFVFF